MPELLYEDEAYKIRGAVIDVHKEMGSGFLEAVYQECLEREFTLRKIPYLSKVPLALSYKGQALRQGYEPDLICFDKIIVELKVVQTRAPVHRAQVLNYLKATGLRLGLLINFGTYPHAQIERIAL